MKNAKIGFLLLSVFAFQNLECKSKKPAAKKAAPVRKAPVKTGAPIVIEQDSHKIEVVEKPLRAHEMVAPSVDVKFTENLENNTITETKVTVNPLPQEGKVVTTTETRTWTDTLKTAAKVAAGAAVIGGAGYLAYHNNKGFADGVDATNEWASKKGKDGLESITSSWESAKSWFNGQSDTNVDALLKDVNQEVNDNPQDVIQTVKTGMEAAEAVLKNPSATPAQQQDAVENLTNLTSVVAKIDEAQATGEPVILEDQESKSVANAGMLMGVGVMAAVAAKFKAPLLSNTARNSLKTLQATNAQNLSIANRQAAQNLSILNRKDAQLAAMSPRSYAQAVPSSAAQYSSGLMKAPDYAQKSAAAQQWTSQNASRAAAQAEINAQQALSQKYQSSITANANRQLATQQIANQTGTVQLAAVNAAGVATIAGGIGAVNAYNNN